MVTNRNSLRIGFKGNKKKLNLRNDNKRTINNTIFKENGKEYTKWKIEAFTCVNLEDGELAEIPVDADGRPVALVFGVLTISTAGETND